MASVERMGKGALVLLFAGFFAGCSGGVGGLLDIPPRADAAGQSVDSVAPTAGPDASPPRIDAPSTQGATALASDPSQGTGDAAALVEAAVSVDVTTVAVDGGAIDGPTPDSSEASRPSCLVTFTVAAAFVDGVLYKDVAVGGDAAALGAWNVQAAVAMTQVATGTWTTGVVLVDGQEVRFRFVMRGAGVDSWENWGPNVNRSLVVACAAGTGVIAAGPGEAGADAAGPVVGVSYAGNFGVQPPDAT
jgi:hypothetical protein